MFAWFGLPLQLGAAAMSSERLWCQFRWEQSRYKESAMGRIVITTNMSLDGVVEDPDGQEGFSRGGWFTRSGGADLGAWAEQETDEAQSAAALLLGRRSDAWFAARWTSRDGEWAARLNALPKFVVSTTIDSPQWINATVLSGDVVDRLLNSSDRSTARSWSTPAINWRER